MHSDFNLIVMFYPCVLLKASHKVLNFFYLKNNRVKSMLCILIAILTIDLTAKMLIHVIHVNKK